jgi:hypothetical protein
LQKIYAHPFSPLPRCCWALTLHSSSPQAPRLGPSGGSISRKDFSQVLNGARRSTVENANILIVFEKRGITSASELDQLPQELEAEWKMISGFMRRLKQSD